MNKLCLSWLFALFVLNMCSCVEDDTQAKREAAERRKEIADSVRQAKEDAESNKPCNRVGKYVYVDQLGVLHILLHCRSINDGGELRGSKTDEEGDDIDVSTRIKCGSGIKRIALKDMDKSLLNKSCHVCIDDDVYDYLKEYGTLEGIFDECDVQHSNKKKTLGIKWD